MILIVNYGHYYWVGGRLGSTRPSGDRDCGSESGYQGFGLRGGFRMYHYGLLDPKGTLLYS